MSKRKPVLTVLAALAAVASIVVPGHAPSIGAAAPAPPTSVAAPAPTEPAPPPPAPTEPAPTTALPATIPATTPATTASPPTSPSTTGPETTEPSPTETTPSGGTVTTTTEPEVEAIPTTTVEEATPPTRTTTTTTTEPESVTNDSEDVAGGPEIVSSAAAEPETTTTTVPEDEAPELASLVAADELVVSQLSHDTPTHILVFPATSINRLADSDEYQIELRTDSTGDGAVNNALIGGSVSLTWTGPPGSGIELVNGSVPGGAPTSSASCTTLPPLFPHIGGLCLVRISSPDDVGSGSLTASYSIPGADPGAPDLPSGDASTNCTSPTFSGDVITQCNAVQDAQRVQASASKTWVGYDVTVEADGTDEVGVAHTFTIDVDRNDGDTATPADGVVANFTWVGPAGSSVTAIDGVPSPGATSCTTDGAGQCTVTVDSDTNPGDGTITVTTVVGALVGDVTTETPTPGSDLTATHTWVEWRVTIEPQEAINGVNDAHVFTMTLEYNDGGGWVPESANRQILASWSGPFGSAITAVSSGLFVPNAVLCNTDANGQCTVTVNSSSVGMGTLTTTLASAPLPGGVVPIPHDIPDVSATKIWVEIRGTVTPPVAANVVGDPHEFNVFIEFFDGTDWQPAPGGTVVTFTWSGPNPPTSSDLPGPDPLSCTLRADNSGTCGVTVNSDSVANGQIVLETVTEIGGVPVPGGSVPIADAITGGDDSRSADKFWLILEADVSPSGTNPVGEAHTFTIDAQVRAFDGMGPTLPGATATFEWDGSGVPTGATPGPGAGQYTCDLVSGPLIGTCDVTVNSAVPEEATISIIEVSTPIPIAGSPLIGVVSSDPPSLVAIPEGSLTATKTWIGYRLTLDPLAAINLWPTEPDHVVTLTLDNIPDIAALPIDGQDIDVTLTSNVSTITAVSAGTFSPGSATCTTDASGTCQVTITSTGPGSATVSAVYNTEIDEAQVSFPALDDAEKTWRTYRVTVAPAADENLLGTPHTFTVTVEETDDGVTWTPVSGATPATAVTAPGVIADETCSAGTDAAGQCTVEVTSPTVATVTMTATYIGLGDDVSAEFTGEGDKTWIDYRVTVSPSTAENLVDTDHVVTVTVEVDRAEGAGFVPLEGAVPTVDTTGVGQVITDTCAGGTAADGTCTVTIGSTTPGTTDITATYVGTAGDSESATYSDSGSKSWLDYRLTVDPKEATNRLNQPHTFVATLQVDSGDGFGPTSGGVLRVDAAGKGVVVTIDPAGPSNNTCVTDGSGTCRITVNSPTDGTLAITVSYDAVAGDTFRTLTFTAQKSWVGSAIPATGSDSQLLVQIATGILAAGLLLLLVARRRRNRLAS